MFKEQQQVIKGTVPASKRTPLREWLFGALLPVRAKEAAELAYWWRRKIAESSLSNDHYEQFYTSHFGLDRAFFSGKRILDIGCGPRGSLEWADMALERVGLDPLAEKYMKLGAARHKMRYVASPAEAIPFGDGHFDTVFSFNSLDHVADLERVINEIKRITKPNGLFLLLTELNHAPTPQEPQSFSWDITDTFLPHFEVVDERHYEKRSGGMYESVREGIPYDHSDPTHRVGILSAKFRKVVAS